MFRFALAITGALIAGSAHAATYTTTASANAASGPFCGFGTPDSASGTNVTSSAGFSTNDLNCSADGEAVAGAGYVAATSTATASGRSDGIGTSGAARADAGGSFGVSGLTFSIADGFSEDDLDAALGPSGLVSATVFVGFSGSLIETSMAAASAGARVFWDGIKVIDVPLVDAGVYDLTFSATRTLLWDRPFSLDFLLNTSASTSPVLPDGFTATATSAFGSTLSFRTGGPVFSLPDVLTINAPEIGIVNNRWIDPRIPDPVDPVPLPASSLLLIAGIAGFAAVGRRKA